MALGDAWRSGMNTRRDTLTRARKVAALTIPHLSPPSGHRRGADLPDPYQSLGARGVNNLASKLLLTLFPPQAAFFTFEINAARLMEVFPDLPPEEAVTRARLELAERERAIMRWLATTSFRPRGYECLRQLIVAGNVVMRLYRDGAPPRVFRLEEFEVERNGRGEMRRLIVREHIRAGDLPMEAIMALPAQDRPKDEHHFVPLFTGLRRRDDGWHSWQEIGPDGVMLIGSEEDYRNEEDVPWVIPRMNATPGEDYGRSVGEEALGDLRTLEGLSQAIVEGAAISAQTKFAVDPSSGLTPQKLARSPNGAYLAGRGDGVQSIQAQRQADLSVAEAVRGSIRNDLLFMFLLNTAVRRQAERVTAEEIRIIARELEDSLGGAFSVLSDEFQRPLVTKVHRMLIRRGELQALPEGLAQVKVVTGLEAVGRGQERERLRAFAQDGQAVLGPEAFAQATDPGEWLRRLALADGIDPSGLVREQQEVEQNQESRNQQRLAERVGPEATKALAAATLQQQQQAQ